MGGPGTPKSLGPAGRPHPEGGQAGADPLNLIFSGSDLLSPHPPSFPELSLSIGSPQSPPPHPRETRSEPQRPSPHRAPHLRSLLRGEAAPRAAAGVGSEARGPRARPQLSPRPLAGTPLPPAGLPVSTDTGPRSPHPTLPDDTPGGSLDTPVRTGGTSKHGGARARILLTPAVSRVARRCSGYWDNRPPPAGGFPPLTAASRSVGGDELGLPGEAVSRWQEGYAKGQGWHHSPPMYPPWTCRFTCPGGRDSRRVREASRRGRGEVSQSFRGEVHFLPGWPLPASGPDSALEGRCSEGAWGAPGTQGSGAGSLGTAR